MKENTINFILAKKKENGTPLIEETKETNTKITYISNIFEILTRI